MTERILITKLIRTADGHADLFARGHQYKDLTLFDLSDLVDVGIDYEALPVGTEIPVRFWAHYELSDKLNRAGNPYKDVMMLEQIDRPATTTSTDTSALLAEMRAIRGLLQILVSQAEDDRPTSKPCSETDGDLGLEPPDLGPLCPGCHTAPCICELLDSVETTVDLDLETTIPRYGDGTAPGDNEAEMEAFRLYVHETGHMPASVDALRAWWMRRSR